MAPHSCTVAVNVCEHHVTIHFKSDNQVRRVYVHPDNIVLKSGTLEWARRSGTEYTLSQNKYQARSSITRLCTELKKDRSAWEDMSPDDVMAGIYEQIGMSPTLWTSVQRWVKLVVSSCKGIVLRSAQVIGYTATAGAIEFF